MRVEVATLLTFQLTDGAQVVIVPAGAIINTPRLYWNVDCFDTVTLLVSVPLTYRVLVPKDDGLGISLPLLEHVEDVHVELFHEYSHDTDVPHDTIGVQYEMVVVDSGARMSIFRSELKSVEV